MTKKSEAQLSNMLRTLKCWTIGKAKNHVARLFQDMVRWEHAAENGGWLQCVTCGKRAHATNTGKQMHSGHFVSGRRPSVIFHPINCHPQCALCNDHGHGETAKYREWMIATYGVDAVEQLEQQAREDRKFTHEELLELKLEFMARTKRAKQIVDSF